MNPPKAKPREPMHIEFDLPDVVRALLIERGIETGVWSFGVRFRFGAVNAELNQDGTLPTAFASVASVTLAEVNAPGPLAFDAAKLRAQPAVEIREKAVPAKKATRKKAPAKNRGSN